MTNGMHAGVGNARVGGPDPGGDAPWQGTEPWIGFGRRIVLWFFGGLIAWSALVSISGAVVTSGTVTVESSYQDVQTLDGGIVVEIPVKNGERVEKGQLLLRLDDTAARANARAIMARVNDLRIKEARLSAERDNSELFSFPSNVDAQNPAAQKAYTAQKALFSSRLRVRQSSVSMLSERQVQLDGELAGLRAQRAARAEQLAINESELKTVLPLFDRGYVSQQRLSPLKRESARLTGDVGRLDAEIAKVNSALAEARHNKTRDEKQFMSEVVDELGRVQASLAEDIQSMTRLRSVLSRSRVVAPRAGQVHALAAKTIGGVFAPGARLMQIIPAGERLVVEAELSPRDVDRVRPGLSASVLFPAFNARTTPRLTGEVAKVSVAELERRNGDTYFSARIEIPTDELAKIAQGHRLVPGMPAEVFIETSSRSILSYLFRPLTDTMGRALREQ